MTSQEKKLCLQKILVYDNRINRLIEERERWLSRACKMTSSITGMPINAGYDGDRIGEIIAKISDIEQKINAAIDTYVDYKNAMTLCIDSVEDERLRTTLIMRYVEGKKWQDIADDMGFDYRWVWRLHGQALQKLTIESDI